MPTRQEMVNDIKTNLPQAYEAIGKNDQLQVSYLDLWASGMIGSRFYDNCFKLYQAEGLDLHVKNIILNYLNISSTGFEQPDPKKKLGDQYRDYAARAAAVVNQSQQELSDLMNQQASATDPNQRLILSAEITEQQSTLDAEKRNLDTWTQTLQNAIASGEAI